MGLIQRRQHHEETIDFLLVSLCVPLNSDFSCEIRLDSRCARTFHSDEIIKILINRWNDGFYTIINGGRGCHALTNPNAKSTQISVEIFAGFYDICVVNNQ